MEHHLVSLFRPPPASLIYPFGFHEFLVLPGDTLFRPITTFASNIHSSLKMDRPRRAIVATGATVAVVGVTLVASPLILTGVGFSTGGVAGASLAAAVQSIFYGAAVPAGSLFAWCQSAGVLEAVPQPCGRDRELLSLKRGLLLLLSSLRRGGEVESSTKFKGVI